MLVYCDFIFRHFSEDLSKRIRESRAELRKYMRKVII